MMTKEKNSPNILLIFCDQLRVDALGKDCGGDGWVNTPALDRMAREGVVFNRAYTNSPVCVPARISMATGLYPHNHGFWDNVADSPCGEKKEHALDPLWPTWMAHLRDRGYVTALFGKTHLHQHHGDLRDREGLMKAYGWDHVDEIGGPRASARVGSHMNDLWEKHGLLEAYKEDFRERFKEPLPPPRPSPLPLEMYADTYVGEKAREWLGEVSDHKPWMAWVSFGGPHEPWDTPEPYASKYSPQNMPSAIPVPNWVHTEHEDCSHRRKAISMNEHFQRAGGLGDEHIARLRANYAGNVELIDRQVGKILEMLDSRSMLENTIVALVSDHGEMNGDMGMLYKGNFLESACRIPLMVRPPKGAPRISERVDAPVELMDIGATLCDLVGMPWEGLHFSRSLKGVIEGKEEGPKLAISEHQKELMICDGRYKLIVNAQGESSLLFDLVKDPDELEDLLGDKDHGEIRNRLEKMWARRLFQTQLHCPGPRGYTWQLSKEEISGDF